MSNTQKSSKFVVVRCTQAGVHAGYLVSQKEQQVELRDSRRLWYWRAAQEAFLSGVARHGVAPGSKLGGPINVTLLDACEVIECTKAARRSIEGFPVYQP